MDQREDIIRLGDERIVDPGATDFPGHRAVEEEEQSWQLAPFRKRLRVDIQHLDSERVDVDLIGIDTSVANALRRCLIAEVPSVSVQTAYIFNNTSIVQDEILAHRIAFVPLKIRPNRLRYRSAWAPASDATTVVFRLDVACSQRPDVEPDEQDPAKLYDNAHVYSSALTWVPQGDQEDWRDDPPRPAVDDILLAKMRPGQEIVLEMHCELGRGKDHAKYSPVCTASYRLMPSILVRQRIPPSLCDKFASSFPPGVVEVVGEHEQKTVRVIRPRLDTVSREVLRHTELKDFVSLGRIRDHFIFSIESTGAYPPQDLLPVAAHELLDKIRRIQQAAARLNASLDF